MKGKDENGNDVFFADEDFTCIFIDCPANGLGVKGQPTRWNPSKAGYRAHRTCFIRNKGFSGHEHLIDPERVKANIPALPTPNPTPTPSNGGGLEQAIGDICQRKIDEVLENYEAGIDEAQVTAIVQKELANHTKLITIVRPDMSTVNVGRQHKQFHVLLRMVSAVMPGGHRLNIWLAGPAGTGKTTAAEKCAEANGLRFASTGSLTESYKLFGFMSPGTGEYVSTMFREIWENGGVFIFDDFDGSDPITALELNNALANGYCSFPDKVVKRHADCVLILTANTWGHGGTNEYVGRMKQDAAFLDRFVRLHWEIDEELERETCGNAAWVKRVQQVRAKVRQKGIRVLVTPRATYYGAALFAAGLDQDQVETATIRAAMTDEQWAEVR